MLWFDPVSDRRLTFRGHETTVIPPGSSLTSDPIALDIAPLSDLAISLYLPKATAATTVHALALQTSYVSPAKGNFAAAGSLPIAKTIDSWPFLTGVDVSIPAPGSTIVMLGDSTTDGDGSTPGANRRLSDALATRLVRATGRVFGVLNEGLIGNRLLRGSPRQSRQQFGEALGESGLTRFDRDVLAHPGVRYVIVRLGINDIGFPGAFASRSEWASSRSLIAGYRQLIRRTRQKDIKVIGMTLSPFGNAAPVSGYFTSEKEKVRQEVNAWILNSGEFDAVVDADRVLRDPQNTGQLSTEYDSGDHLHPNNAGYTATAEAIPLGVFDIQ